MSKHIILGYKLQQHKQVLLIIWHEKDKPVWKKAAVELNMTTLL